jgi:CRISPR-associated protein Cmx8
MTSETISLDYHLAQLPTVSHRAGLAGLAFLILYLHRYDRHTKTEIKSTFSESSLHFECTQSGLQSLLNLFFSAHYELRWSKTKIKDPIEIKIEKDQSGKELTLYGWHGLVIDGLALCGESGLWKSLWSEWMLNTIRAFPKSREPFKLRAERDLAKRQSRPFSEEAFLQEAKKTWQALKKPNARAGLSSSAIIGAEAATAEGVSLENTNAEQFLLNFWPVVSQPYIPCKFKPNGDREDWGYAVAIPDVLNLELFVESFDDILGLRSNAKYGYRPAEAMVELPEESALESLRQIQERIDHIPTAGDDIESNILGFEVCHAYRPDPQRGPELKSIAYLPANFPGISQYAKYRTKLWCPWVRRHLLQNLLRGLNWTERWDELFSWVKVDEAHSKQSNSDDHSKPEDIDQNQKKIKFDNRYFVDDCWVILQGELVEVPELVKTLNSLCHRYLEARLKDRGLAKQDLHKLARQEFLAVRSYASAEAFQKYFFGRLCSRVSPGSKPDQFTEIAQEVFDSPEKVRGLTMLALASNFKYRDSGSKSEESEEKDSESTAT